MEVGKRKGDGGEVERGTKGKKSQSALFWLFGGAGSSFDWACAPQDVGHVVDGPCWWRAYAFDPFADSRILLRFDFLFYVLSSQEL